MKFVQRGPETHHFRRNVAVRAQIRPGRPTGAREVLEERVVEDPFVLFLTDPCLLELVEKNTFGKHAIAGLSRATHVTLARR